MNNFKCFILYGISCLAFTSTANAMFSDDPLLYKVMSEFEYFKEDNDSVIEWDINAWRGRDLNKLWIKSSGEYANSEFEGANIEFVYSRAISAYWDQQFGVRHDFGSGSDAKDRNWLSYGYVGTASYFIEVGARIFIGEESSSQLLIELEKEMMITQEWVLTPELKIVANGRTNQQFSEGAGLAEVEFGLKLGYEHNANRKFQPFIGLTAHQKFGTSKRFAKLEGHSSADTKIMIGIHAWF